MRSDIADKPDKSTEPGDFCPHGLDRSLFTNDQLVYLDSFFLEYDNAAMTNATRLLSLPVPGVISLHRTRCINLTVIDYLIGTYVGADTLKAKELAKLLTLSTSTWSLQVSRMKSALQAIARKKLNF